ncbi:MAG: CXXX repeat peptide maturase [Prevotella sp.]|nr:CXXX repeat peptide maturase [Prevotella sp.]
MLTHLIIMLDDTSVSYCHYNGTNERILISLDDLKAGIVWAMKENLNVQFVYPDYELPTEYNNLIDTIDHINIKPENLSDGAEVVVLTDWKERQHEVANGVTYILKTSRNELEKCCDSISDLLKRGARVVVVLTDIETFTDADILPYKALLEKLAEGLCEDYQAGKSAQLSLLTDRIMLNEMNNCNAGVNNITLAPNGRFYLCPAFYYDNPRDDMGDLKRGLNIKNQNLLDLDHAPICRNCDAYHCKRCIWMNCRLTFDLNTPSHQQCVIAHLERNASKLLQQKLKEKGIRLNPSHEIQEIDYLDPFSIINKWK